MTIQEVATKLVAWAKQHNPEIVGDYTYPAALKNESLPDVAVNAQRVVTTRQDDRFPVALQTRELRIFEMELSFVANSGEGQDEIDTNLLRTFADRLIGAVLSDPTLGNRVPRCSEEMTASFDPPFVVFDDGQRGRFMSMDLAIAEPI